LSGCFFAAALLFADLNCSSRPTFDPKTDAHFVIKNEYFKNTDACFIVYDVHGGEIVNVYGEEHCRERYTACSTFKVPLAVMAFDAGVLQDEKTLFEWDGVKRSIAAWNQDQTATTWMQNSVVWYSQNITALLGAEKLKSYLKAFDYGNQDFSGGLTSAWLTPTKSDKAASGTLKISAFEQLEFWQKFWKNELPVKPEAIAKTKNLVFLENTPSGYAFHGKTGSGYLDDSNGDFGWFVGHIEGHGHEYLTVTTFTRAKQAADPDYPGLVAREVTEKILKDNGLW
jgi:beta-lactamase class D